jgi:predicted AAA+ superfamily ATPase
MVVATDHIRRSHYLNTLGNLKEERIVKVLTGVRGCGKTTIVRQYIDTLLKDGVSPDQIISIDLENLDKFRLQNSDELYNYITQRLSPTGYSYIFIDEAHLCRDFEVAIGDLFKLINIDIYLTGSNANIISNELINILSGKYVKLEIYALSFKEFVEFHKNTLNNDNYVNTMFQYFLFLGAFPAVSMVRDLPEIARNLLTGVFNSIMVNEIANRVIGPPSLPIVQGLAKCLLDNIGNNLCNKKVHEIFNTKETLVSLNTLDKYTHALIDSYLVYRIFRYDLLARRFLKSQCKYYTADLGLRFNELNIIPLDLGHILENIVYLELRRRGFDVCFGKLGKLEIDFIASGHDGIIYIQVAESVLDETALYQKLDPLNRIDDNFPKILLSMDTGPIDAGYNGIVRQNVIDWLLS